MKIRERYKVHFNHQMSHEHPDSSERGLSWWRDYIFLNSLLILLLLATIVIIPSLVMAYRSNMTLVFCVDLLSYIIVAFIFFNRSLRLVIKKHLITILFYILAVVLLIHLGFSGPAYVFLLFNSLLAVMILNPVSGYTSVALNLLITITYVLVQPLGYFDLADPNMDWDSGIVITLNFGFVNLTMIYLVASLLKGLEQTLAQDRILRKRAEEADALKTQFLANISHEIRTPLNSILGFSSLANDEEFDPTLTSSYFKYIQSSGEQLLQVINGIIDLSLIESGQTTVEIALFEAGPLIEEIYKTAVPLVLNNHVQIIKEFESGISLESDRGKIQQTMLHLLTNSIKYTEKGFIKFGCFKRRQEVVFYVEDTGIGIPQEAHKDLFTRFFKARHSNTIKQGAGLGLATSRKIVEMLGGTIWFHSEEGNGSEFFFSIPVDG